MGPFRPVDPIRMNHPAIPGTENILERRDIYLSIWRDLGWQSDDVEDNLIFAVPAVIHVVPVAGGLSGSVAAVPAVIHVVPVAGVPTAVAETFDKPNADTLGPNLTWTRKVFLGANQWRVNAQEARFQYPPPPQILENFDKADGVLGPQLAWTRKVYSGDPSWAVVANQAQFRYGTTPDLFVLGATKPTVANTGLVAPTTITSTGGTITYSANDQLIENTRFERFVNVTGKRITFRNCQFVGPTSFTPIDRGLVNCSNTNCEDITFERCHFEPTTPSPALDAVFGHHFTAHRCLVRGVEDGFGLHHPTALPVEVVIEGCYVDALAYHSPNFSTSDNKSHNDCIQLHPNGHRNFTIFGNTLVANFNPAISDYDAPVFSGSDLVSGYLYYPNGQWGFSAVQFGSSTNIIENGVIDKNWIDGGEYGINCGGATTSSNFTVRDNRLGRGFRNNAGTGNDSTKWGIKKAALVVTTSGNAYEDNGTPNNTWKNG